MTTGGNGGPGYTPAGPVHGSGARAREQGQAANRSPCRRASGSDYDLDIRERPAHLLPVANLKSALLLLGPTASGKTPLGDYLEKNGLWGKRCFHFDFGARLRAVAGGIDRVDALTPGDIEFIHRVLETGALLEGDTFNIARKIFRNFVETRQIGDRDIIVLNGLPRHAGQAADMDAEVRVQLVVRMNCPVEVVRARIRLDSGGDRAVRADDAAELVARKLKIFTERTIPLIDHYRAKGARIENIDVGVDTKPADIVKLVSSLE